MKPKSFIREKKVYCGERYLEVDIIPRVEVQNQKKGRNKKERVSAPKQRNLNDKNAKRYFTQLINTNFNERDIHVTITYAPQYLPETIEAAEREATNYLRRIAYRHKKLGLPALKYVMVTEYSKGRDGERPVRIHHHIIMSSNLDRDVIEELWCKPRKRGQKKGDKIGYANADRLQPDNYGFEALARYLVKCPNGKKRWSSSQNLKKPYLRNNDYRYSRRRIEQIVKDGLVEDSNYWARQYPGWTLTDCKAEYYECSGWSIYLKMRREAG